MHIHFALLWRNYAVGWYSTRLARMRPCVQSPALGGKKKSHSWNSNSKCLEKKTGDRSQSHQLLQMQSLTDKADWPNSLPRDIGPSLPFPAWSLSMWIFSSETTWQPLFSAHGPTFHHCLCPWVQWHSPKQLSGWETRIHGDSNFYSHPDLDRSESTNCTYKGFSTACVLGSGRCHFNKQAVDPQFPLLCVTHQQATPSMAECWITCELPSMMLLLTSNWPPPPSKPLPSKEERQTDRQWLFYS
jgi:hypothetical protein